MVAFYLSVPGRSLYPDVKIAVKNATVTKIIKIVPILCIPPFSAFYLYR